MGSTTDSIFKSNKPGQFTIKPIPPLIHSPPIAPIPRIIILLIPAGPDQGTTKLPKGIRAGDSSNLRIRGRCTRQTYLVRRDICLEMVMATNGSFGGEGKGI